MTTARIRLTATLRRLRPRRLRPLLRHGSRRRLRRWCPEFLNWRTRLFNPLLRHRCRGRPGRLGALLWHFAYRGRDGHPGFRGRPRHFRLAHDLRCFAFAGRLSRTFDTLNIPHFPTLLPILRRHHRPWLTLLGACFGRWRVATHWCRSYLRRAAARFRFRTPFTRTAEAVAPLQRRHIGRR
jgi:hypothetical protein